MVQSNFTQQHLVSLIDKHRSFNTPLSVVAHIDLDAFYAQCEQIRLGLSKRDPVVCRQWNGLIAISYAARQFGISRHETAMGAREKCKDIVFAHVATFKKGDPEWKYHDAPRKATHKVSLDPYRRESRKIFSVFSEYCKILEKASIDETYLDMGQIVYEKLVKDFPELAELAPGAQMPDPPTIKELWEKGYEWIGCVVGSTEKEQIGDQIGTDEYDFDRNLDERAPLPLSKEESFIKYPLLEINDWDDVCLLVGSMYMRDIRKAVFSRLGYTCSAGISRNKILSKLGSSRHKPARQTIIRSSVIESFLDQLELYDVGGLGGKLGEGIKERLNLPDEHSIKHLRSFSKADLLQKLDPALSKKILNIIYGNEASPVGTRLDAKSMTSTKNFSDEPIPSPQDAREWLRVFASELRGRVLEISESSQHITMYPKTITVSFKSAFSGSVSQNKQLRFPTQVTPAKLGDVLYELGCTILTLFERDLHNKCYPCSLLALGLANIENNASVLTGNKTLTSFFKPVVKSPTPPLPGQASDASVVETDNSGFLDDIDSDNELFVTQATIYKCPVCYKEIETSKKREHDDFHFAVQLSKQHTTNSRFINNGNGFKKEPLKLTKQAPKTVKRLTGNKKNKVDKNQTFLKF